MKTKPKISATRALWLSLLPLLGYISSWYYNGQTIPLLALSSVLMLAWGGTVLWPRLQAGLPWPRGFLPVFMLLWLFWYWLTLFWSHVPYSSWFYFWTLGAVPLGFLFWVLQSEGDIPAVWPWFWRGILVTTWVLVGIAFWEYFDGVATGQALGNIRVQGPLLDTNSFAAWMNLLWFVLLGRFFYLDGQRDDARQALRRIDGTVLFYLVTLTLTTFAFWMTYSRGGALAWLCTFLVALIAFRKTPGFGRKLALVLAIEVAAYAIFGYLHHYDMLGHLAPGYISSSIETVSRGLMWIATWHIFLSHPYLGTGLGSYFLFYPAYRLHGELASAGTYAHNDYIEFLAEGGLINLGFLLAFAGTLFYALYRLIIHPARLGISEENRYWALGLVLGVFAITGHALGNFIFYNLPLSILAGIFLAQAWRLYQQPKDTAPLLPRLGIRHPGVIQLSMALLFVLAGWFLALDAAVYGLFSANAWLDGLIPNANARAIFLMKAARFLEAARPQATQPWVYTGNAYLNLVAQEPSMPTVQKKVLLEAALHQYRQSLVGIPRQAGVYNAIGSLYLNYGSSVLGLSPAVARDDAVLAWRKGLALTPESVNLRSEIATQAFFNRGDVAGGIAFLQAGLKRPLFPEPRALLEWVIARSQWLLAHDPKAAEKTLIASLEANPDFGPTLELLREIVHAEKTMATPTKS
ncbi:O-antigen ligase family protein [Acidithiobacillus caldus]|nr:O-antigen ligase family protein [Acidithiobacillus caldus]MBU2729059.1 O-antigen ligase family protein [Acidithiobacillus caldus]MBU2736835.1 O-antigen ligase family protein [Acidithiobacillus caldus ATCC 51756]MBU2746304.1 O-antigen ligase family protein [Acidithiobacillus caldus]MBU2779774.1 O-antigen ligase family protein [Acidithiobacillus caldus]WMT46299.1 MAG: O-antigen ligase family protein [Acidithiobacillus caldus]